MAARAIFKAHLALSNLEVPVKFYAAVEDRGIQFRLLHETDREPVVQELVDKSTEEPVGKDEIQKAYPLEDRKLVKVRSEELSALEPSPSRAISITRFVDRSIIEPSRYDRPYYLGPDGDEEAYFALCQALAQRKREGVAHWVMRKRAYVGALREHDGYLVLVTLRRTEEVLDALSFARPRSKDLSAQEIQLAQQLTSALQGDFAPASFQDDYRARVLEMIERKANGQVIPLHRAQKPRPVPGLADALKTSLKSLKNKKTA